ASSGVAVHLVTHRASPDLRAQPHVTVHDVARPFGSHALGSALLARAGARTWRDLSSDGVRAIVNGGNCRVPDAINWVHYVHAAYRPTVSSSPADRVKARIVHRRDVDAERHALREARVVICNSVRTKRDVVEYVGVEPSRVAVVYYGSDPDRFSPVSDT